MVPARVVRRIVERVEQIPDGCWIWPGATSVGYGRISWVENGEQTWAGVHRVIYEALVGPIPEGFDIDHLCHDPATCRPADARDCQHRRCCNPAHLATSTRRANLLRGGTVTATRSAVIECPAGHPYDEVNTYVDKKGRRSCRTCTRERNRAYYHANNERRKEYNRQWRAKR